MNTTITSTFVVDENGKQNTIVDVAKKLIGQPTDILNTSQSMLIPLIQQYVDVNSLDISSLINHSINLVSKLTSQSASIFAFGLSNIFALLFTLSNFAFYVLLYFTLISYFLND